MHDKSLNITNGDYFNEYFIAKFGGEAVPFCEAIMDGDVVMNVYSEEFIQLRSKTLHVSETEYRAKMYVYDSLNKNTYSSICLWFGKDTFCQMNLLTLLVYLEQMKYCGKVTLNYINDETFEIEESDIDVKLGIYSQIYEDVLIAKHMPNDFGILDAKAIELYFDYHSDNGMLANMIRMNVDKDKTELIGLLLKESTDYGLSDLQAERLISTINNGVNEEISCCKQKM